MPKKRQVSIKEIAPPVDDENRAEFVKSVIFERAIDLFLEKGFSSTSMNDLADACQVSKPALYHYVPNKAALLEMLYDHVTRDFFVATVGLAESKDSPATKLARIVAHQVGYNIRHRCFLTVFWRERAYFDAEAKKSLARRERDFEGRVIQLLEEGKAAGEFHHADSRVAALSILGLLSTVQRWAHHSGVSTEEVTHSIVEFVMKGLCGEHRALSLSPDLPPLPSGGHATVPAGIQGSPEGTMT